MREHAVLEREELSRWDLDYYSGEIAVAVVHQAAQLQLLAGEQAMFRKTDLDKIVTFTEILAT